MLAVRFIRVRIHSQRAEALLKPLEFASNVPAFAFRVLACASNVLGFASNVLEFASNVLEFASNGLEFDSNMSEFALNVPAGISAAAACANQSLTARRIR